ncbi:HSD17B4 [Mytilus edulis]|uniref:Peroxisomal multifunctional enzyme type 2 n=1 Tax=Mytilus edulis TaxID=6550 RepID=A0A8S3VDI8_MYTED|nr:HSD17B4 [Mytilus edulis]
MAAPMRYDGKVALITGAGNGIGRDYALAFAARGASVVVNDLGGDMKGGGRGTMAADKVVEEIRAKGGKAVPNYDSVEEGEKLVQTALENFGRIDIVVNNAGILRDRSFARISDQDWDLIHRVHLRGSFQVTRAAWPHMKKNKYGRIIMVTSAAGIYGNFGQANYSAAKLGVHGMANTLAIEGKKDNIKVNTVAPMAGSRMTETVMPPDVVQTLKPEYVAPLVLYLTHDSCEESGSLFEVGGGWIGKLRWERTIGATCRTKDKPMTPEDVRENWDKITDFTDATHPTTSTESTAHMLSVIQNIEKGGSKKQRSTSSRGIDPDQAINQKMKPTTFTFTKKKLYFGVSTQQEDYLKFLFELSDDFCVIPSFAVVPAFSAMGDGLIGGVPGLNVDPTKILHGEQYTELYKPFPTSGTLTSRGTIVDVLDKGSGAVILMDVEIFNEKKEKIAYNQFSTFIVGAGKFKARNAANPPSRAPDASMSEKTSIDQVGFDKPILHGLCSYGYATRHVMKTYCDNDVSKIKAIKVRFAKPVLPGQTLQTDMWKEGSRVFFQCKVVETGNVSLSGAYIDLNGGTTQQVSAQPSGPALKSDALFAQIQAGAKSNPGMAKKINSVFLFDILKDGKSAAKWTVDMKSGSGEIYRDVPKNKKADCTMIIEDDNMVDMASGKLNGQQAFMTGKVKIKGNIMLAQKLGELFAGVQSKL